MNIIVYVFLRNQILINNKLHLFIITIMSAYSCSFAKSLQESSLVIYDELTQKYVYIFVEEMPSYKNGDMAFISDFNKNFQYCSSQYPENNIQTILQIQFIIDSRGNLIGDRIYNKSAEELTNFEKAGLKAINALNKWKPGIHKGKKVNVILTKTIHIDMNNRLN